MTEQHLIIRLCIFPFIFIAFIIGSQINGQFFDLFFTDRFYFSWFEQFKTISISSDNFIDELFSSIKLTVKSPEPVSHLIVYIAASLNLFKNADLFFQTLNIFILISFVFAMNSSKKQCAIQIILLIIMLCLSYYWLVLFQITHRLKIGVLFLIWAFWAERKNKRKLSAIFLGLAIGSHLSLMIIMPLLAVFRQFNILTPVRSLTPVFIIFLVVYVPYWNIVSSLAEHQTSLTLLQLFKNKLFLFAEFSAAHIYSIAIVLCFAGIVIEKRLDDTLKGVLYLLLLLAFIVLVGTSRTLMLIHIILFMVIYFNPSVLIIDLNRLKYITLTFFVFSAYDTYKLINLHIS